ncbi:hypothetical protein O181_024201 [Austropuccinia psidii MF-1]|uniref:Uncharacterized protein n=1 Tax=Austropuccinia psidii MF-1 TaxID=1389203 RepID=A0A9Q3CG88_9BASI|nr:hypothetical protein [Austropuccinia psidii MF-1]
MTKKQNSCHNLGPSDHYANNFQRKKIGYAMQEGAEEETPAEDSEADSMGDTIGGNFAYDKDPKGNFSGGVPRGNPIRNSENTFGRRITTRYFQLELVQTHTRCTDLPNHTN